MDEIKKNKREKRENPTAISLKSFCEPEQGNKINTYGHIRSEKGKTNTHLSQIKAFEEKAT